MPLNVSQFFPLAKLKSRLPFPKLGVRCVVIAPAGEILLVRHTYIGGWYLPGGGVDKGESAEAAIVRELAEEANVEAIGRPQLHGLFFHSKASPRHHVACYIMRAFRQNAPHVPDLEIAEARFFAPEALPIDATRATRARIAEVVGGRAAAETW